MARRKLILDVDTGVDDAQALMMALAHSDVSVVALTCVVGNVGVDAVCANTQRVLRVCKRLDIPVFRGASESLLGSNHFSDHHGVDGMGGTTPAESPDLGLLQSEHASSAMVGFAKEYPGELSLVCLAPLTNIALAMKLDPEFGKRLKEVFIMGGNIEDTQKRCGRAEFNFFADPEAADMVLRNLGCPITLLPYEVAARSGLSVPVVEQLQALKTPRGQFYAEITKLEQEQAKEDNRDHIACDAIAMAIVLAKSVAMESKEVFCAVERSDSPRHGEMVVDWKRTSEREPNVALVLKVNMDMIYCFMWTMIVKL